MDVSKIIRGIVNSRGYTITSAITQWDYGYVFVPEFEDMPATYRLDFSNDEHHGTALPVYCGSEGGEVPEELIDTGKDIWVWFFYIGDGFGKSEYKWRIPNKCKPKTEQDEPTPSQQSSIDQAISVVNDAVERAEDAQEAIENMSVSAETLAEGESATVTKTESEGVVHLAFGIPRGEKGLKGDPGRQGDTGESPYTVELTTQAIPVRVDADGYSTGTLNVNVDFVMRHGTEQVWGQSSGSKVIGNVTYTRVRDCTPTQTGRMNFQIPQGTKINNSFWHSLFFWWDDELQDTYYIEKKMSYLCVRDGEQGESALGFSISNPSAVIHADKDGYTTRQTVIKPIISVFKGETELTYAVSNVSNIGVKDRNGNISSIPATVVSGMNPKWTIPADRMFFPESGELSITVTADGQSKVLTYGYAVVKDGEQGEPGAKGNPGDDGYSPTASVDKSGKTATITITDKTGTTSAQVEDGTDGTDGVSPTVSITPITGGHRITITDKDGSHSADVMDGTGNVDDVQINGTSITENGVADIPIASNNNLGVVKTNSNKGVLTGSDGILGIRGAGSDITKNGTTTTYPLVPAYFNFDILSVLPKSHIFIKPVPETTIFPCFISLWIKFLS